MSASLDLAKPKLGSGDRFRRLSATLAARGASNPDALAAYIGQKKYGAKGMGRLSHGKGLANPDLGIYLAEDAKDDEGATLTCPECNYSGPASGFGFNDTDLDTQPEELRTPAPSTGSVRDGAATTIRSGNAAHALSNTRGAVELAAGTLTARRHPIQGPLDVLVSRQEDGTALLRHRNGGALIASLRKDDAGKWVTTVGGRDLTPRDHQRTALMEAVGTWNKTITGGQLPQSGPLQAPPQQTDLMAEYGIPAIRALATPSNGASDGPRMTNADAGASDSNGLNAKGQGIYKKLLAKGFPEARALAFAKNSQNSKPGQFGKA